MNNLSSGYFRDFRIIKEIFLPAFGELEDCLKMTACRISRMSVNENILDGKMYDSMFSVEEVDRLVTAGMPFRDAYKKVVPDIEAGNFVPDKNMHHTHAGSSGNLCNDKIAALMDECMGGFDFENAEKTFKMKSLPYYIIAAVMLFASCGNTEYEFSQYPCHFVFDNNGGRSPKLAAAMNSMSAGVFCHIRVSGKYFYFDINTSDGGADKVPFVAIDEQRTIRIGVYNESGIIVGYGALTEPKTFYVYDNQCPNCYKSTQMPRYALTMTDDGHAVCGRCGRTYDMNNGGIISSGPSGDKMIRYHGNTTGSFGVLSVIN